MRMGWVLGWAIPQSWFAPLVEQAFRGEDHVYFDAGLWTCSEIAKSGPFDWLAGYSLGSLLLLDGYRAVAAKRVALLAPIFAFSIEEKLGGRVPRSQVRYLARWLRRDPGAAIADFSSRAGLDLPALKDVPIGPLEWGLGLLESTRIEPSMPEGWRAFCGDRDPLLDAARLHELVPEVTIVAGATHHPLELLHAFRKSPLTYE